MSPPRVSGVAAVLGAALVLASGPAYRAGVPLLLAYASLAVGAALGLAALLAGAFAIITARLRARPTSLIATAGVLVGLVAFGIPFVQVWSTRGAPAIHDISTDLVNPPTFDKILPLRGDAGNDLVFRPETAAEQQRAYGDVAPLYLPDGAGVVFDRAIDVARELDWEIAVADRSSGRIEATATTAWFGFKDDIVVRVAPQEMGSRVDVRSASRTGIGDRGRNADRIREFLSRLPE